VRQPRTFWRGLILSALPLPLLLACQAGSSATPSDGFAVAPPVVVTDGSLGGDAGVLASPGAPHAVEMLDGGPAAKPEVGRLDGIVMTPDRGPPDGRGSTCSLMAQDCGPDFGCYVKGRGESVCENAGKGGRNVECREHPNCEPGSLCVEAFGPGSGRSCQPMCDPTKTGHCPGTAGCRKLNDVDVGFCEPS
jgi:hypothetical protein